MQSIHSLFGSFSPLPAGPCCVLGSVLGAGDTAVDEPRRALTWEAMMLETVIQSPPPPGWRSQGLALGPASRCPPQG